MRAVVCIAAACLCGTPSLRADFAMVEKVEGLGQATEVVTKYHEGSIRLEVNPGTTTLINATSGETIHLLPAQKRFFKASAGVVQAAVANLRGRSSPANFKSALIATGRKETIAGYPADEYRVDAPGSKIALWLTKAIPNYEQATRDLTAAFKEGPLAAMSQNYGLDLADLPGFPVRQVNEPEPGQTITTTLVSISTAALPGSDFAIPADYTAITSPELTPRAAVSAAPRGTP